MYLLKEWVSIPGYIYLSYTQLKEKWLQKEQHEAYIRK